MSLQDNNSENSTDEGPLLTPQITKSVKDGRITGYTCLDCDVKAIEVQAYCTACGSSRLQIVKLESRGKVLSFTIQTVSPKEFTTEAPYAWAVIELDGGVRISGWIASIKSPNDLAIGQRVQVVQSEKSGIAFEKIGE